MQLKTHIITHQPQITSACSHHNNPKLSLRQMERVLLGNLIDTGYEVAINLNATQTLMVDAE